ncbi:MAG: sugar ABC transporter permease [Lachnospiraceae bacterium]|nr:sugar ABC transporter permease [Lachnospiraceae bacterium]
MKKNKGKLERNKYGYIFIAPFFLVYLLFQLYPLILTFYYSVNEYYFRNNKLKDGGYIGLQNFKKVLGIGSDGGILDSNFVLYLKNTGIIWLGNFIPQLIFSLLVAAWLTNNKAKLKAGGIYKILVYLPNIITAASIATLFRAMFSKLGPMTTLLRNMHIISEDFDFMSSAAGSRGLISFILFWMWYGNTSLLLISGMLGINESLYEAADIDGANGRQKFFRITLPLLRPILVYVLITSAIGGLQMYDIPALFNNTGNSYVGGPDDKTTTMTMYIMRLFSTSRDYGRAAAVSVLLFIITIIISIIFLFTVGNTGNADEVKKKKKGGAK